MSYKAQATVVTVAFDGEHEFAGLTLRVRPLKFRAIGKLSAALQGTVTASESSVEGVADHIDALCELFSAHLVSWDMELEDEDGGTRQLGVTAGEVAALPEDVLVNLIGAWFTAVAGVSESLGKDSSSGETSRELLVPMGPPSQNLAS